MIMDKETYNNNLKTLKETILDEQKLVTYISLSKELCIHVNDSKSLLSSLVEDFKKNQPDFKLNITYILSGLSDNNVLRTTVCSEVDLEPRRRDLKTVYFQHVYSVSHGPPISDNAAYVALSKFEDLNLCNGLIRNNSCMRRSSDEIGNLKAKTCYKDPILEPVKNTIPKRQLTESVIKDVKNGPEDLKICTKPEPKVKSEVHSPKKEVQNGSQSQNKRNGDKSKSKSIAGFFSKTNVNTNKKPAKTEAQETTVKIEKEKVVKVENNVEESQEVEIESMSVDEVPVKKNKKASKPTKSNKGKNSSLSEIKKNAKVDNKRKRVLHVSDSESDNEKNDPFADEQSHVDNESDDEIPPTPLTNTVKITSGIVNPKKRRKIVDKTYTDEEGYILTKKEEVYESCSDHEEDVVAKENIQQVNKIKLEVSPKEKKTKNSKVKVSPPSQQKAKQPTMMNFFKKI